VHTLATHAIAILFGVNLSLKRIHLCGVVLLHPEDALGQPKSAGFFRKMILSPVSMCKRTSQRAQPWVHCVTERKARGLGGQATLRAALCGSACALLSRQHQPEGAFQHGTASSMEQEE